MIKKITLVLAALSLMAGLRAETLLNEGFETWSAVQFPAEGWSVINDTQEGTVEHWVLETGANALSGKSCLTCDVQWDPAEPVKEEWIITPALTLRDTNYNLSFLWMGAWAMASKKEYDLQVRVTADDGKTWDTIFSFLDQEDVENSGVVYPWSAWQPHSSLLSLNAYAGKTIKIAFVHCLLVSGGGNIARIDDVLVEAGEAIDQPIASVTPATYIFEGTYIGVGKWSEKFALSNTGVGTLTVSGVSGLEGTDFSTDLNPADVSIKPGAEYEFYVKYTPSSAVSNKNATMTIHTNGGDVTIDLEGTKIILPEETSLESFEGDVFPPVGWTADSGWSRTAYYATSGDYAASCPLAENNPTLVSPRLDCSTGTHTLEFNYANIWDSYNDGATGPESEFEVYFSKDGKSSWTKIASCDSINKWEHMTVDLGTPASDNCYVMFKYVLDFNMAEDSEYVPEYATSCVDDVILPPYYGRNDAPGAVSTPSPENGAKDIYNEDVVLTWESAQFAQGYKVYVGASASDFSIVNGAEVTECTYTVPSLEYATTYYWKVVAYNDKGETASPEVWSFTTIADQTVSEFPWAEGFDGEVFPPLGWRSIAEGNTDWDRTNYNTYDGAYSALISAGGDNEEGILQSPGIVLPADKKMQISFYWGNSAPAGLTKSTHGTTTINKDTLYFEVKADGVWKTLAFISGEDNENQKWERQRIVLGDYVGKTVNFRWRYSAFDFMGSGAALDKILVEEAPTAGKGVIDVSSWDAGEVNYNTAVTSKGMTLLNDGEQAMTITGVSFKNSNFTSSLHKDMVLESRESVEFYITFAAGTTNAPVEDEMTITFDNAPTITLPVSGSALGQYVRYFSFEDDEFGSTAPKGFTTVDADHSATVSPVMINYPNIGNAFAYIVINQLPEPEGADWRNIYPRSGDQLLATVATASGNEAVDWIISEQMTARENAHFRFYAKSYDSDNTYHPWSYLTVLVSTTDNAVSSFTAIDGFTSVQVPHKNNSDSETSWTEFDVDLSSYAGQPIYVAIRNNTPGEGFVTFFDDFYFEDFEYVRSDNSAPYFTTVPVTTATVGKTWTYNYAVADADGDDLTVTLTGKPFWITHTPGTNGGTLSGIPGQAEQIIMKLTVSDGSKESTQEIVLDINDGSGIEAVDGAQLSVYPNPVASTLYFTEVCDKVMVTDISGKQLLSAEGVESLDVSALSNGVYFVTIQVNDEVHTTQIVKK